MGRRDEPKLDELQRLLRRLEYMEVDKTPETSQKATSGPGSQGSGYVGALRGAQITDMQSTRRYAEPELEPVGSAHSADRSPSPGTAPIVIGATTAAVVSTMIVVGLLLGTQGKEEGKNAEQPRLSFVVPKEAGGQAAIQSQAGRADASKTGDTQSLLQRADQHIRNGRLSDARELLEEAAKNGSGVAALTLGAMYDPSRVAEFGNLGVQADPTLARAWYERAKALGVVEANDRLAELARK